MLAWAWPNAIDLAALSRVRSQALKSHRVLSPPGLWLCSGSPLNPAVAATSGDSASTTRCPLASTWTARPVSSSPRATKPGVWHDFFRRPHIMDYDDGEDFNGCLMGVASVTALGLVGAGAVRALRRPLAGRAQIAPSLKLNAANAGPGCHVL